jgi:hypothetical protein
VPSDFFVGGPPACAAAMEKRPECQVKGKSETPPLTNDSMTLFMGVFCPVANLQVMSKLRFSVRAWKSTRLVEKALRVPAPASEIR